MSTLQAVVPVYSCDLLVSFFFFNDRATTEIYTLSLHDALPILSFLAMRAIDGQQGLVQDPDFVTARKQLETAEVGILDQALRSEEHTSELQSLTNLVCRLLLEKKKKEKTSVKT